MKMMLIFFAVTIVGCKGSNNKSFAGDWKFQYLTDSNIKTTEDQTVTLFLNQLTEGTIVTFKEDSFFVNHRFYGRYDERKKQIKINEEQEYLKWDLIRDTLILSPDREKSLSLKFTRP